MKKIKIYLFAFLSAGWLLPLCFAASAFKNYLQFDLETRIMGKPILTSFPILDFSLILFKIAAFWLGCVIIFWVVYFLKKNNKD